MTQQELQQLLQGSVDKAHGRNADFGGSTTVLTRPNNSNDLRVLLSEAATSYQKPAPTQVIEPVQPEQPNFFQRVKNKISDFGETYQERATTPAPPQEIPQYQSNPVEQWLMSKIPESVQQKGLMGAVLDKYFPEAKSNPTYEPDEEKLKVVEEQIRKLNPEAAEGVSKQQQDAFVKAAQDALIENQKKADRLRFEIALKQKEATKQLGYAFTPHGINDDPDVMKAKDELVLINRDNANLKKFLEGAPEETASNLATSFASGLFKTVVDDVLYTSQSGQPDLVGTLNPFRPLLQSEEMARYHMVESKVRDGVKLSDEETALYNLKYNESRVNLVKDVNKNDLAFRVGEGIYGTAEYIMMIMASGGGAAPAKGIVDGIVKSAVAASRQSLTIFSPRIAADAVNYLLPEATPNPDGVNSWNDLIKYEESGDDIFSATAKAVASNWSEYFIENGLGYILQGAGKALNLKKGRISQLALENGSKIEGEGKLGKEMISTIVENPDDLMGKGFVWKFANKMFGQGKPLAEVASALKKAGINGLPEEVLEEEVTELVNALIEGRAYKAPFITPEGTDRLLVETLVIAPFGGIASMSESTIKNRQKFLENNPDIESFGSDPKVLEEINSIIPESERLAEKEATDTALIEKAEQRLEDLNIEVTPENVAVEELRFYMNQPPQGGLARYLSEQSLETLAGTGIEELDYDTDNNIVLYRAGETQPDIVNSYSLVKKFDDQTEFTVNKDEIVVNTMSKELHDKYVETYKENEKAKEEAINALEKWNDREAEIMVKPAEVRASTIGEIQQKIESPDIRAYEDAFNAGDYQTAEEISQRHPNDTTFAVHKRFMSDSDKGEIKTVVKQKTPRTTRQGMPAPVKSTGTERESRVYSRVTRRLGQEAGSLDGTYNQMNIAVDAAAAEAFVNEDFDTAIRVARGLEAAPRDVTSNAISLAVAEKAYADGDYDLAAEVELIRSLRLTRAGQEIVTERGRLDENSPQHFVKQLIDTKMDVLVKSKVGRLKSFYEKSSRTQGKAKVDRLVDTRAKEVRKRMRKASTKIASAQSIIDAMTCK